MLLFHRETYAARVWQAGMGFRILLFGLGLILVQWPFDVQAEPIDPNESVLNLKCSDLYDESGSKTETHEGVSWLYMYWLNGYC